jgi:predicted transcriptional regulator
MKKKTISMSFRVSEDFKQMLEAAAAREHRSLTNMLETLLFNYCQRTGIESPHQMNPTGVNEKEQITQ